MSKSKAKGGVKAVVAVIVVIVIIAALVITWGCGSDGFKQNNPLKFFNSWGKGTASGDTNKTVLAVGSDGEKLTDGSTYAMGRGITYLTARDYNNQEYAPTGEITLTATLSNEYINGAFDWSVDFTDKSYAETSGRVASYFVSVTPDEQNSSQATLKYLAPFGKQIEVKATLRGTESADTCTVDCLKTVSIGNYHAMVSDFDDEVTFMANVNAYGVGTVKGEFVLDYGHLWLKDEFVSEFKKYLNFDIQMLSQMFSVTGNIPAPYWINGTGSNAREMIGTDEGKIVTYASFIAGFDDYDQAHKEAIYYAWRQAVKSGGYSIFTTSNLLLDISFNYVFNGVVVQNYCETDYVDNCMLYGDYYGDGIAPSVTLNKNIVIGGQ